MILHRLATGLCLLLLLSAPLCVQAKEASVPAQPHAEKSTKKDCMSLLQRSVLQDASIIFQTSFQEDSSSEFPSAER